MASQHNLILMNSRRSLESSLRNKKSAEEWGEAVSRESNYHLRVGKWWNTSVIWVRVSVNNTWKNISSKKNKWDKERKSSLMLNEFLFYPCCWSNTEMFLPFYANLEILRWLTESRNEKQKSGKLRYARSVETTIHSSIANWEQFRWQLKKQ